jgi:polysaccharide biosynthesis transport protein
MQRHEQLPIVYSHEIVPCDEEIVRVVPVWASPPDVRVLAMLDESRGRTTAASLRVIRHRLELRRAEGEWTVGVTSARDGEGKSTFAAQLALVLGESQRARVLLVEASMHRPSIARLFGFCVPEGMGFSTQLAKRMRGVFEPWSVLALGPALHALVENEAESGFPETLHSTHFRSAIERLGRAYDWIVVDSASVLGGGDANVVEEVVDGMVVVARSRASKGRDLRAVVKQLGDRKTLGVVLWDAAGGGTP